MHIWKSYSCENWNRVSIGHNVPSENQRSKDWAMEKSWAESGNMNKTQKSTAGGVVVPQITVFVSQVLSLTYLAVKFQVGKLVITNYWTWSSRHLKHVCCINWLQQNQDIWIFIPAQFFCCESMGKLISFSQRFTGWYQEDSGDLMRDKWTYSLAFYTAPSTYS